MIGRDVLYEPICLQSMFSEDLLRMLSLLKGKTDTIKDKAFFCGRIKTYGQEAEETEAWQNGGFQGLANFLSAGPQVHLGIP